MAAEYVDYGYAFGYVGDGSLTQVTPTLQQGPADAGDLLILYSVSGEGGGGSRHAAKPADWLVWPGFAEQNDMDSPPANSRWLSVWYKEAAGGEVSQLVESNASYTRMAVTLIRVRGANLDDLLGDFLNGQSNSANVICPAVAGSDGALVLHVPQARVNVGTWSNIEGVTQQVFDNPNSNDYPTGTYSLWRGGLPATQYSYACQYSGFISSGTTLRINAAPPKASLQPLGGEVGAWIPTISGDFDAGDDV